MSHGEIQTHLVRLIVESGDGNISENDLAAANGSLSGLGYSSLSYIRLIDAIENEFGVYIDPDADVESFATVDSIAGLIAGSTEDVHA